MEEILILKRFWSIREVFAFSRNFFSWMKEIALLRESIFGNYFFDDEANCLGESFDLH